VYRTHAAELEGITDEERRIERLVELNVAEQVHNLAELSFIQLAWKRRHQPTLHGWVYDIHTGRLKTVTQMEPGQPLDPIYSYEFPEE
jgi:carbonic anhydrase